MNGGYYWAGLQRRLSRRRLLEAAAAGGAGLGAVALAGCGGDESEQKGTPAAKSETPQRGGTAKLMLPSEPPAWDPQYNAANQYIIWNGFVSDKFMEINPSTRALEPAMVSKWEYPDPTTLVMTVKEGVRFHDRPPANGRAMTSADVAYTLQRATTNDPNFLGRTNYRKVDAVETPDARTVRVRLKEPTGALLTYISGESVVNREQIEASGGVVKDPRQAIGTGPFMVTEYQAGSGGKMVRNPNYWDSGKPYLDTISWAIMRDRAALIAAYRTGDLDFGTQSVGAVDATERKQLERDGSLSFPPMPVGWPALFLTQHDKPPFNDIRVRQAVDLVTDRKQLVEILKGGSAVPTGPIWDGFLPGYGIPDKELLARPGFRQPKDQDIAEAKKLLAAAGHGQGLDLPADGTQDVAAWQNFEAIPASVDQFAKAGIKLHVEKLLDRATYLDVATKGTALFREYAVGAAAEPYDQLFQRYYSKATRNYQRYNNPQVDQLIDQLDRTLDEEGRKKIAVDAARKIMDDVAVIHLIWATDYAVLQPTLRGVVPIVGRAYGRPAEWWRSQA